MEIKSIYLSLKKCGIKKGDTIMLHGDAGIATQLNLNIKNKLSVFYDQIINYVGKRGTILVPTFTYSACKKKFFDIQKSQSEIGIFSEYFRKFKKVKRTKNPIFSFAIYGKKFGYYEKSDNTTCFGKNSIFDFFLKDEGKIVFLGCDLDRATFTHYVEELLGVDYRYHKNFKIRVMSKKKSSLVKINYFVRKLNKNNKINLNKLYLYLKKNKLINEKDFGRYNLMVVKSKDFFKSCINLLNKNKCSLIGRQ